jgi:hypothetical protein
MPGGGQFTKQVFESGGKVLGPKPHIANLPTVPSAPALAASAFARSDNNYSHEGNNYVVSGQKPQDTDVGPIKLNEAFIPNLLDNYDVVTYHWKLFIVTPDASATGDVFNLDKQIIIAESGVSDLTIDGVVIESLTTPSVDSGTGTSTNVKFNITEPAGAGLIDKIFYESLALGIGNWNVMPFYLQLQFKGRDPVNSSADTGTPGAIGNLRWLWALKLNDMKANVTMVGTKYEVSAIVYNELAQSNAYFTLQHTTVLEGLSTVDDAMAKLQQRINEDQIYRLIDNASIPDTYQIKVDPIIAKYRVTPSDHNTDSVRNDDTVKFDGKNASFVSGTSVDKIIDTLLAQTPEYQELIKNSNTPGANGKTMNDQVSQMKKFWRIITESRPIKFDPRQNNYAREFTIFVVQYDIGVLDTNTFQDSAGDKTIEAERRRLETYVKKAILKKKYNYIFTGLNDQIINFDIRINNAFASATARMGGIYYNAAMADKGVVTHNHSYDEGSVTEKLSSAIKFQHSNDSGSVASKAAYKEAQEAINTATLPPGAKERYTKLLENAKPESWTNFAKSAQAVGGIDQDGVLARQRLRAQSIATPIKDKTTDQNLRFISDVNPGGADAKQAYNDYVKGIKGKLRPVARIDSMQQRQIGAGIESSSNSGIQKLSSIFSVAMHSTQDVSFAKISLNIKGDPFWLFPQPTIDGTARLYNSLKPDAEAFEWIKRAHFQLKDAVNITGTDNFIIVRFRTPRVFDIGSTLPDDTNALTDVETFSGVFKVVSITSKFEAGKFHQELQCLMDYNINILNFMEEIETNNKTRDIPASPESLVADTSLVKDFSIKPRIMGKVDIPGVQSYLNPQLNAAEIAIRQGVQFKGPNLGSNIPTSVPSILAGLPSKFTGG